MTLGQCQNGLVIWFIKIDNNQSSKHSDNQNQHEDYKKINQYPPMVYFYPLLPVHLKKLHTELNWCCLWKNFYNCIMSLRLKYIKNKNHTNENFHSWNYNSDCWSKTGITDNPWTNENSVRIESQTISLLKWPIIWQLQEIKGEILRVSFYEINNSLFQSSTYHKKNNLEFA